MLCWVYIVDGAQAGCCAASAATTWAPSIERSEEVGGCEGLPSLETQPNCVDVTLKLGAAAEVACHFAVSGDRLPNHTEGQQLNGRDELSRKARLRLGKDSTGVEEYPNQDKLHKISVLLWDSNPGLPDGRPRC